MTSEVPGELVRWWRRRRGKSQLTLALDAGISQRHLSFLESGRSAPSRSMVLLLAEVLRLPLRERNRLLVAAGYAPVFAEAALDEPEMAALLRAVDELLAKQEPYPALVLDRHWNVIRTNRAAPRIFGAFVDLNQWPQPRNLLELVLDPRGLKPAIENWQDVAAGLLQRVEREAVGQVFDEQTEALLDRVLRLPGVRGLRGHRAKVSPVIPIHFLRAGERSAWFSLVATVGAPQAVAAQELRVELMFPA